LGLALVISKSILVFNTIKYIGVTYLMYLGVKALLAKDNRVDHNYRKKKSDLSRGKAFAQGFLCNVLNPKATLFFLSVFTIVIDPTTPVAVQILYGMEMFVVTFLWFAFLGTVLTQKRVKKKIHKVQNIATKVMGGLLVALGIKIAVS